MSCCKEKAVLVAVYEEKPRKKTRPTRNNVNIKHHHYHHHHHHLHVHQPLNNGGGGNNRRAQLLSYSKHLRDSSKSLKDASKSPPQHPKSNLLVASTTNTQQTTTPVVHVQTKQRLKKQSSWLDMKNIFKCFAVSRAQRKVKKKKKKNTESSGKKASVIMKTFNARTQKGAQRFFKKLMATIQKYR